MSAFADSFSPIVFPIFFDTSHSEKESPANFLTFAVPIVAGYGFPPINSIASTTNLSPSLMPCSFPAPINIFSHLKLVPMML